MRWARAANSRRPCAPTDEDVPTQHSLEVGARGGVFFDLWRAGADKVTGLADILGGLEDELEAEEGQVESPVL